MNDGTVKIGIEFEVDDKELRQVGKKVENSVNTPKKTIEQFARDTGQTVEQVKQKIASLAAEYQAAGMTVQNAFKRAYSDLGVMSDAAAKRQRKALEAVEQAAEGAAKSISGSADASRDAEKKIAKTGKAAESFAESSKDLENAVKDASESFEEIEEAAKDAEKGLTGVDVSFAEVGESAEDAAKGVQKAEKHLKTIERTALGAGSAFSKIKGGIQTAGSATNAFGSGARLAQVNTDRLTASLSKLSAVAGKSLSLSLNTAYTGMDLVANTAAKSLKTAGAATAAAYTSLTSSFGGFLAYGAKYSGELEQLQASFETMTGSAKKAEKIMREIEELGALTPFDVKGLSEIVQMLMQFGLSSRDAIDYMQMMGDIAQGDSEKLHSIARAFGQMSSAGKVNLEDINQMIDAGFNPLLEISESTGESMASLYDRISKGTIAVNEITASMNRATSAGGRFYGSMERQSQTLFGQISTLQDNFAMLAGTIAGDTTGAITTKFIPALNDMIQQLDEAFEAGGLEGFANRFGFLLGDVLSDAAEQLPQFMTLGTDMMESVYSGFIRNKGDLRQGIMDSIEQLPEFVNDNMQMAYNVGEVLLNAVLRGVRDNSDEIASGTIELVRSMVSFFASTTPEFTKAAGSLIHSFAEAIEKGETSDIYNSVVGILNLIPDFINQNLDEVLSIGGSLVKIGTSLVSGIIESIEEALHYNYSGISETFDTVLKTVLESVQGSLRDAHSIGIILLELITSGINENSDLIAETAVNVVTSFFHFIRDNLHMVAETGENLMESLANSMKKNDTVKDLAESVSYIILYMVQQFADNSGEFLETSKGIIEEIAKGFLNYENFTKLADSAKKILRSLVDFISENGSEMGEGGISIIRELSDALISEDVLQELGAAGFDIVEAIIKYIGENIGELSTTASDIVGKIVDELTKEETLTGFYDACKRIMETIKNDLLTEENMRTVGNSAGSIVGKLFEAFTSTENTEANRPYIEQFIDALFAMIAKEIATTDWNGLGFDIAEGIISGITGRDFEFADWFKDASYGLMIEPDYSDKGKSEGEKERGGSGTNRSNSRASANSSGSFGGLNAANLPPIMEQNAQRAAEQAAADVSKRLSAAFDPEVLYSKTQAALATNRAQFTPAAVQSMQSVTNSNVSHSTQNITFYYNEQERELSRADAERMGQLMDEIIGQNSFGTWR